MPEAKPQKEEPDSSNQKPEDHRRYNAPLERAFYHVRTPFQELLRHQTASGLVLLIATGVALFAANSTFSDEYAAFTNMEISLAIGSWSLTESLRLWVNDGLMGIFFLAVGLEIKREILVGELSSKEKSGPATYRRRRWNDCSGHDFYFDKSFSSRVSRVGYSDGDRYRVCHRSLVTFGYTYSPFDVCFSYLSCHSR